MEFHISQYTSGQKPEVPLPSHEIFNTLGEEKIRNLVNDHYNLLIESGIKHLFPQDNIGLEKAKKNSSDFFIQICGGPMYFNKNRGRPMMYKRHLPHKITPEARQVWLECYAQAIRQQQLPDDLALSFWNYIDIFSMWMVNHW
ncbi:hemoglobin [Mariniphaga anaerophila]|uniref:Hemoglobin n=1 Tax=Mariniphaga anaerophila TaxID=1484053 RepID=A0A1M4YX87_9BACT|nr:globin [Mariniphaga anaerophila]SHF10132.1 hemoglobin [Mariniphaga anaerophila]